MKANNQIGKSLVCVRSFTFNHAPYIVETLEGFCMQQTTFPFVCTLIDDCSTDGEQEIIRKYLQEHFDLEDKSIVRNEETDDYILTYARHKTNYNCFFAVLYLKYNHYSIGKKMRKLDYVKDIEECVKYIATCEGDDYWIDPYKLQKQVDALEAHPECSICFSTVHVVLQDNTEAGWSIPVNSALKEGIITLNDYTKEQFGMLRWTFHTSSYFYRKKLQVGFNKIMHNEFKVFPYGDTPLVLFCLMQGNGFFLTDEQSCYRWQSKGSWSEKNANNNVFKVSVAKRLIEGLKEFDKITSYQYDVYVNRKIIQQEYLIDEYSNNYFRLFALKYWDIKGTYIKHSISLLLKKHLPSAYFKIKELLK